jgi:type I restriction enzyme R subunit
VPLEPYAAEVRSRFVEWMRQKREAATTFTTEQHEWLNRIAEHIATSLAVDPAAFQDGWFGQQGGYGRAFKLFGDKLQPLLAELNERLAA